MEWNEFVQRLARELTHLPDSAFLIVQLPGGFPYVQAMRSADGLSAEVVSNEFLPVPLRLGPEQQERLAELDWRLPGQEGHVNWWQQILLPAEFDDFSPEESIACGRLAASMAAALNEVFQVRSPFDLEYRANQNGPENGPIDLPYFGLRSAETATDARIERVPVALSVSASGPAAGGPVVGPAVAGPRAPRRQDAPEPDPASAQDDLEVRLTAARERGDQQEYFALLLLTELVMPSTGDPAAERYATATFEDGTYVLAFTSRSAMEQSLRGQAGYHRRTTFGDLARNWPRPEWRLAINAGLPTAAYIDSDTIARLSEQERATADPRPAPMSPPVPASSVPESPTAPTADPAPVPPIAAVASPPASAREPEPVPQAEAASRPEPPPRKTGPTIMQKVVPHQHVSHYLENAYDQVAGYVHRVQDVLRLDTPEQLVRSLGLTYEGSPFSDRDEAIHVIRWPVVKGSFYRPPYGGQDEATMRRVPEGWVVEKPPFLGTGYAPGEGEAVPEFKIDSQRLPHGAEMYRVDRSGAQTFVAFFDADHRRWIKVEGA